jgi:hypothetical protein
VAEMRLIDADLLYDKISKVLQNEYNSQGMLHEYSVSGRELSKVLNFITEQPTAYDVDKTIGDILEALSKYFDDDKNCLGNPRCEERIDCYGCVKDYLMNIMERGGIE